MASSSFAIPNLPFSVGSPTPSLIGPQPHAPPSPQPANISTNLYIPQSPATVQIPGTSSHPQPPFPGIHTFPAGAPNSMTVSQSPLPAPPRIVSRIEADKQPWKYRGYPAFCKWMSSDDDFFVFRRFGRASARVILHLQDQITLLESQLEAVDRNCREGPEESADNGTFRYDHYRQQRGPILAALTSHIERYQRFVLDHSALKTRPNASSFQIRNVTQWLKNAKKAIEPEEIGFLERYEDLVSMVAKEKTPLRRFIDRFDLVKMTSCIRERKVNERLYSVEDFEMETTVYNKDTVVDKIVTCLIMLLGLGMLIGPLWWLQYLSSDQPNLQARLGVITGFLVVFTILLSILTVARPFEVLAATAAYGAVLMVFMQLGSSTSGPSSK